MAPATKPAAKAAPADKTKPKAVKKTKVEKKPKKKGVANVKKRPRNYTLGNGVHRFSRSRMYHKKGLWKFTGIKHKKAVRPAKPITIEKPIGGDKNGKTRTVLIHKRRNYYPTSDKIRQPKSKGMFRLHKRTRRSTIRPGTVSILLAGPHKGKRVVVLKQLKSGLLLVTGPFKINACPMRRINQIYVIATRTRIPLKKADVPSHLTDDYFKRDKKKRPKKAEGDIFSEKKERYQPSEKRKLDQKIVDKKVLEAIRKHKDHKLLVSYLSSMFGLRSSQYPHRMKF